MAKTTNSIVLLLLALVGLGCSGFAGGTPYIEAEYDNNMVVAYYRSKSGDWQATRISFYGGFANKDPLSSGDLQIEWNSHPPQTLQDVRIPELAPMWSKLDAMPDGAGTYYFKEPDRPASLVFHNGAVVGAKFQITDKITFRWKGKKFKLPIARETFERDFGKPLSVQSKTMY